MKPTYHVVQMVLIEKELKHTICAVLKAQEKEEVKLVGGALESGDGYDYLRALGQRVTLRDFLFTNKLMVAEALGEQVGFWYVGMQKPWKFYGTMPVEFEAEDLQPPFNYSLPCEEFYLGRAMHRLYSMEMNRSEVLVKKMLTFGDYKSPRELFEAGFKKMVDYYTNPQYTKAHKNCGLIPIDISDEDLARKRKVLEFLER